MHSKYESHLKNELIMSLCIFINEKELRRENLFDEDHQLPFLSLVLFIAVIKLIERGTKEDYG